MTGEPGASNPYNLSCQCFSTGKEGMVEPILREIPEEFETRRLTVRCPRAGDGAEAHAAIVESAERLRVWIPWAKPGMTVDEEEIRTRQRRIEFLERKELHFYMFLKGQDRLVGMSALH